MDERNSLLKSASKTRQSTVAHAAILVVLASVCGCLSGPQPGTQRYGASAIQVPENQRDMVWERAVAVLNNFHFMVARESKLEGVIETQYRAGSNLLEPWNPDSVGYANRLESTVQSIRRKVTINSQNSDVGLVTVSVRVDKEIEDVPGLAANYEGGATFSDAQPLQRDLNQVIGQSGPSRWLPRGNDPALEAEITRQIQFAVIR